MKSMFSAVIAATVLFPALALDFTISADHADCIYKLGEKTTFTVKATGTEGEDLSKGTIKWQLNNFGDKKLAEGEVQLPLKDGTFKVTGEQTEPGFLRLDVWKPARGAKKTMWGVLYNGKDIVPGTPYPEDFNDFWKKAVAQYDREVTEPIKVTEVAKDAKTTMYELVIPSVEGRHVWGYCSVPNNKSKAPFPVKVNVPGAGPASWGCDRSENEISLKVNVHYYDPVVLKNEKHKSPKCLAVQKEEDMAWAKKYPVDYVRYTVTGIAASREDYFYYGIILAANRAVNWVAARPDIDRTRFRYSGGSQGGGFGLILTGLNKNITAASVFVPAITDLLSSRISNRESGWPRLIESQKAENREAAAKNAPYFCGVNFARQITVPIRFEVGFIDTVCPPHAGHAAYNVCPSKDKDILYGIGQGHSVLPENKSKMYKWLQTTQSK